MTKYLMGVAQWKTKTAKPSFGSGTAHLPIEKLKGLVKTQLNLAVSRDALLAYIDKYRHMG